MRRTWLAALVAVVGLSASVVWGVTAVLDQVQRPEDFARARLPGQVTVTLTQLGRHVVYQERAADAGADPAPRLDASSVQVIDPRGQAVAVIPYTVDLRYDHLGSVGTAVAAFEADRTGTYHVAATSVQPMAGALAVGDDLAPGLVRALLLPALAALASMGLAGVLLLAPTRRPRSLPRSTTNEGEHDAHLT